MLSSEEPQLSRSPEVSANPTAPSDPSGKNSNGMAIGLAAGAGGCLIGALAIVAIPILLFVILGDVMSGGQVPGHGQSEINHTASSFGSILTFGILGLGLAIVGFVYAFSKRKKK